MAQTPEQLRLSLAEPNFGVAFMIENNPGAIADNLRGMGFIVSDSDGIVEALNTLLARGDGALFVQALSVPVVTDRLSAEEVAIVMEQGIAMGNIGGAPLKSTTQPGGGFNVGAAFAGLAAGYLTYMSTSGQQQVNPQQAAAQQTPAPQPTNYTPIIIGVLVVVAVIAVIYFLSKKK